MNENRESKWEATSKVNNQIDLDADISNLNDDDSFIPYNEENKKPLTEEEKEDVRKKLFFLLILIGLVLIGLVIVLIFNPFAKKKEKIKDTETKEELDKDKIALNKLDNGNVPLSNLELTKLITEITYNEKDSYENDTFSLFKNEDNKVSFLSDKNKLFLLSKTSDFKSLINNTNNINNCDTTLNIETKSINKILEDRFDTSISNYEPIIYQSYEDDEYINTYQFTYENGNYVGRCHTQSKTYSYSIKQSVIDATKDNDLLHINIKVAFENETGVYKEPTFQTLIADKNQSLKEYINNVNTYQYTYNIGDSTYSLVNVTIK